MPLLFLKLYLLSCTFLHTYYEIMKISATSALVLNWTATDVWTSKAAKDYTSGLDLSEGNTLLSIFNEEEQYLHLQAVSNRKFFVRKKAIEFIVQHSQTNTTPQIIVLAAGIAPLSVDLAALHSNAKVFDVDKYLMEEKKTFLQNSLPNIAFLSCDITDIALLKDKLEAAGWDKEQPTLVVMEGIIYYLPEASLKEIFRFFAEHNCALAGDFGLRPEDVDEYIRHVGEDLFTKIRATIGLPSTQHYEPNYFLKLLAEAGYPRAERTLLSVIQKEFRGSEAPFEGTEPCWISMFVAAPQN